MKNKYLLRLVFIVLLGVNIKSFFAKKHIDSLVHFTGEMHELIENYQDTSNCKYAEKIIVSIRDKEDVQQFKEWILRFKNSKLISILSYYGNARIKTLPANFSFPELLYLNISYQGLIGLPKGFDCPKLKRLGLSKNRIDSLPEKLHFPFFEELWMGDNRLEKIPIIEKFPQLKKMDLRYNSIKDLPDTLIFPNLIFLNLGNNNIHDLPTVIDAPNLEILDLDNNDIYDFPTAIDVLNIKRLYLARNPLTDDARKLYEEYQTKIYIKRFSNYK